MNDDRKVLIDFREKVWDMLRCLVTIQADHETAMAVERHVGGEKVWKNTAGALSELAHLYEATTELLENTALTGNGSFSTTGSNTPSRKRLCSRSRKQARKTSGQSTK